jgi:glycine/D-amino acid oxidase-like deaminating enzyme
MICITRNQQPFFGKLSKNIYAFAGMNGVGVAKGTYLGFYMGARNFGKVLNFIYNSSNCFQREI